MLKPFLTDYDHQGPLPGVDRFFYDVGNIENWIPWISLYLAGSMTLTGGFALELKGLISSLQCSLPRNKNLSGHN